MLQKEHTELVNNHCSRMSIMEKSHRGKEFYAAIKNAETDLRTPLVVPDTDKESGGSIGQQASTSSRA
jgi:phosphoserine aminotransferase